MPFIRSLWGIEIDWLGCDSVGHVALFSTAGGGLAPLVVGDDVEAQDDAIARILAMPVSTVPRFSLMGPQPENTWHLVAERGLFAYDADLHGGPYKILAAPAVPVFVDALPEEVRSVVRRCTFTAGTFASTTELGSAEWFEDHESRPYGGGR